MKFKDSAASLRNLIITGGFFCKIIGKVRMLLNIVVVGNEVKFCLAFFSSSMNHHALVQISYTIIIDYQGKGGEKKFFSHKKINLINIVASMMIWQTSLFLQFHHFFG